MSEELDAVDVDRVLAGETDAFAGIVRRWQGRLVTLAFRFSGDRDQAEEMAQSAFLRAFRMLSTWRRGGAFSRWLFALAANVYRSEMRRRRLLMLPLDAARDVAGPDAADSSPAAAGRSQRVRRLVRKLPGKYRDALVLFYFHQMNVQETALSLGLSEGTVKARLHRGRALLRRALEPLMEPPSQEAKEP